MCREVGYPNGYRIILIIQTDGLLNLYKCVNHRGDGSFVGGTKARRRDFYLIGCVFKNRNTGSDGETENRTAYLGDAHGGFLIVAKKKFLECEGIGLVCIKSESARRDHMPESVVELGFYICLHAFGMHNKILHASALYNCNPAPPVSRVNSEDFHIRSIS